MAATTYLAQKRQIVYIDPAAGPWTIQAPANPSNGDYFSVLATTVSDAIVTIDGNGKNLKSPVFGTGTFATYASIFQGECITLTFSVPEDAWMVTNSATADMRWRKVYDGSQTNFEMNDVCRDGQWTMIANKQTTDRPGPQPVESFAWVLPDSPTWTPGSEIASVSYTGFIVEVITDIQEIIGMRCWIPEIGAGISYRMVIQDIVNDVTFLQQDLILSPTATGWATVGIQPDLVSVGQILRVTLITSKVTPGGGSWGPFPWQYDNSVGTTPDKGKYNRDGAHTLLYVHEQDNTDTFQNSNLGSLKAGDYLELRDNNTRYDLYNIEAVPTLNGSVYTIPVTRIDNGGAVRNGNVINFTSTINAGQADAPYVYLPNYWQNFDPDLFIKGFATGDFADVPTNPQSGDPELNDNAYGIDVFSRELTASPDWDVVAYNQ